MRQGLLPRFHKPLITIWPAGRPQDASTAQLLPPLLRKLFWQLTVAAQTSSLPLAVSIAGQLGQMSLHAVSLPSYVDLGCSCLQIRWMCCCCCYCLPPAACRHASLVARTRRCFMPLLTDMMRCSSGLRLCSGDEAAARKLSEAVEQPPSSKRHKGSAASAAEPQQVRRVLHLPTMYAELCRCTLPHLPQLHTQVLRVQP